MKKRLLILSSLLFSTALFSQQDPLVTHFIFNKMTFNPAAAGIDEGICGTLLYRNQWDRVTGAPNSAMFNGEARLDERNIPIGVGVSFVHDAIGYNRQNNLNLNLAYHFEISNVGLLAVGASGGLVTFGLNPTWIPPVTMNDAALPVSSSARSVDVNFGLYYKSLTSPWYAGISATHLTAPTLQVQSVLNAGSGTSYSSARHFYAMGGYKFMLGGGNTHAIDAQGLIRTDLNKLSADLNVRYIFQGRFYGGVTYRVFDGVAVMLGGTFSGITVGYSYDLTLNKLQTYSRGSHEILLKYCYYLPPIPIAKSKHPRYL